MSKKLDSTLIKQYFRPADITNPKGGNHERWWLITAGLLFSGVTKLAGPINALLIVSTLLLLYLFMA